MSHMKSEMASKTKDVLVPEWVEPAESGLQVEVSEQGEPGKPRLKPINRQQMMMRRIDMKTLIEADHASLATWKMLRQGDLRGFDKTIRAVEGRAGQATVDPRLLAGLWIYGYSEGVSSARELSRMCDFEPGCQWLSAMAGV